MFGVFSIIIIRKFTANQNEIMTEHGRVIVISDSKGNTEVWGSITQLSKEHNLAYNYLKRLKYPYTYRGVLFQRLNFRHSPAKGKVIFGRQRGDKK